MSSLSDLTIELCPSRDFRRVVLILHAFAVFVVWQSSIPAWMCVLITLFLCLIGIGLWQNGRPCLYHTFSYRTNYWRLQTSQEIFICSHVTILFDGGFFWMMRALEEQQSKTFVVFHDQMSEPQRRMLALFHKIHQARSAKLRSSLNLW